MGQGWERMSERMGSADLSKGTAAKNRSFYEYVFTHEFDAYRSLPYMMESQVVATMDALLTDLEATAAAEDDEELRHSLYGLLSGEEERRERSKSILFNSLFTASYALFEHKMSQLCDQVQRGASKLSLDADKEKGSGLDRAKDYLKALEVDFPAQGSDWEEIVNYKKVRNLIMHAEGSVAKCPHIARYAKKRQILSSWTGRELQLDRQFCEEAIDNLEEFIVKVHRACDSWRKDKEVKQE